MLPTMNPIQSVTSAPINPIHKYALPLMNYISFNLLQNKFFPILNTDNSGNDINCYQAPNMTPNQCYNECLNNPNCVGYNQIPAGFNSNFPNQGCCTKNSYNNLAPSPGGINFYLKNQ